MAIETITSSQPLSEPAGASAPGSAADRRRAARVKRKFISQMTPWAAGHASVPFDVIIDDVSELGAGIIHDQPLELGMRHLLTVPREEEKLKPITREYVVTRCVPRGEGKYSIGLELAGAPDDSPAELPKRRVTSKQLKLLFLLFGIFGLIIATFAPL